MGWRVFALLMGSLLLTACGGGGSGGGADTTSSADDDFGIAQRVPLAPVDFPLNPGQSGSFDSVDAFPNLSFVAPVFFAGLPGTNQAVVVEQGGVIHRFDVDAQTANTDIMLDISSQVLFSGEQGLLGLAFHPDFANNGFFYVHYSASNPRRSVISRFTYNSQTGTAATSSEFILLEVGQPYSNHNAGSLAFGPDDKLYIAFGDGGSGGDPQDNAQNRGNLLGSIVRIDVDNGNPYSIPPDNPFIGVAGVREEIWAYGFRNPFRLSFDRQTGTLWVGDVGQNSREEIDIVEAGGNYGWRVYEGTQPFSSSQNTPPGATFIAPVFEYDHSLGNAVIGGYVYRGAALQTLRGAYVYGDFGSGRVWSLLYNGSQVVSNTQIASVANLSSFGEDNNGELYAVSASGSIYRFIETGGGTGNTAPPLLSQTGIFTDTPNLVVADGFIEYAVNAPLWSDGTLKRRWMGVPEPSQITFAPTDAWSFPVGTVVVKHFEIELLEGDPGSTMRLETRVLVREAGQWTGYVYKWNDAGTDADLLNSGMREDLTVATAQGNLTFSYEYPGQTDCLRCHNTESGSVLGLERRQTNRDFDYQAQTDNQLRSMNHIALFSVDIGAASQYGVYPDPFDDLVDIDRRARSYLAVNCAPCHRPGGPTPVSLDLRFDTPLPETASINVTPAGGDLGLVGASIVTPGNKESSVLWERMRRLDGSRMPPLGSHRVDTAGVDLIGEWIDQL
jgi:uncharacterized repeat protein (TIGR03806 family)